MNTRRAIIGIVLAAALAAPIAASAAANGFVPLAPQTGNSSLDAAYNSPDLSTYINTLFKIAISVGAMIAVLRLVYAGYIYMVSGVGNWGSQGKAKEIIGNVVFGLLLLLAVYLILYQINPDITNLKIALPSG
jgi:hypothetical protein